MNHHKPSESNLREYIKFAGVLVFITVFAYLLYSWTDGEGVLTFIRFFMGVFLVVFATFKFIGYEMFVQMFRGYDLIAKRYKAYSYAYPFIELFLGVMFLFDLLPVFRKLGVLVVMSIGAVGVFQEIYHKRSGIHCACLGNIIKLPLSTVSLVEDLAMILMASIMLIGMLF